MSSSLHGTEEALGSVQGPLEKRLHPHFRTEVWRRLPGVHWRPRPCPLPLPGSSAAMATVNQVPAESVPCGVKSHEVYLAVFSRGRCSTVSDHSVDRVIIMIDNLHWVPLAHNLH